MIGWGFLGAGSIARSSLAPAVHRTAGAALHAVASRDPARAAVLGPAIAYGDYDELLQDPRVQIVYIALHNSAHEAWTLRALAAGKHVLCEKPLGLDAAQVERMARAADAAGLIQIGRAHV